jgi:hypothetical protein
MTSRCKAWTKPRPRTSTSWSSNGTSRRRRS